jgi:SET domain-containing protein
MCWTHLLKERRLRIRLSLQPNAGKGVFAQRGRIVPAAAQPGILFRRNDVITEYGGQPITQQELQNRYGMYTAPYGAERTANIVEDAACRRGVGAMVNHRHGPQTNVQMYVGNPNQPAAQRKLKLRALRNIREGQELFMNYGPAYLMNDGSFHQTK